MNMILIAYRIMKRVEATPADYSQWRIGITNDLPRRFSEHSEDGESLKYILTWQADSLTDAQALENFFIHDMGMKGGTGGKLNPAKPVYVYIM